MPARRVPRCLDASGAVGGFKRIRCIPVAQLRPPHGFHTVGVVELLCTSGFPALYTSILTLRHLDQVTCYGYLLLYNVMYTLDDIIILGIGLVTLSQQRLQEREGRALKFMAGLVMIGLGIYLVLRLSLSESS